MEEEGKEINMKLTRFSSCRGVAFEINPNKTNPFALTPVKHDRNNSFKIVPRSNNLVSPSRSRTSSHFCDIDIDGIASNDEVEVEFIAEVKCIEKSPDKVKNSKNSRLSVIILDQGFTVYKILFLVCLSLNIIALVFAASGNFQYGKNRTTLFCISNILALTLCRSEAFLRLIFWVVVKTLGRPSVHLKIKTLVTSFLQNLGGIHSGCGVSSIVWLVYSLVLTIKHKEQTSSEIIILAFSILTLISLSSLAAFPIIRHLHHNLFERTHRFAGWMALILLWFFIFLSISYNPISKTYNVAISELIKWQEFWFTLAITILIITPWLTVRKVKVKVSAASSHASVIKFQGGVKPGLLGRISPNPLSEWHAFGIISDGGNEHFMLAGAVGDYTESLITNAPSHIWVRTLHFAGLPYLINMYQRVVLVATGSGICVFLSFLIQPCPVNVFLVWVAKDIEKNFGKEIVEFVGRYSKEKIIVHDSAISGRPNVGEMSVEAAIKWDAEVVIVTSNPEGSRDVVRACKKARIPAFGPVWDS